MEIIADEVKLRKDHVASLLINKIKEMDSELEHSILYYNFPFYRGETQSDLVQAHVLFVSPVHGVIFFRCLDVVETFDEEEKLKLNNLDGHIFAKINKYDAFRSGRRELKINVTPLVFVAQEFKANDALFLGLNEIKSTIRNNKKVVLTQEEFDLLIAVIEGTANIKPKKERDTPGDKITKGKVLSILQSKEAVFDMGQKRAALNIIDSPQRIRGLAGSGKTIILTMKAALYHLQHPEAEILYTYFTKALYGQIRYLIEKYYRDFSENREPNWSKINIWHGWGGKGLRGVYSDTCAENHINTIDFVDAKKKNPKDPFDFICQELSTHELKKKFDLTLIDEGQDFPKSFYRLCYKITKESRIVWAYDDFQNIFDVDMQDEKETFGMDENGKYYVDFSREENRLQDIILYRCYRNPRYALLSAFALGLGIYNNRVLQRLENNKHWEDLGFTVEQGESKDKDHMIISRSEDNSPRETNEYFHDDSVKIKLCQGIEEECDFIVDQIEKDITIQKLRPDDICVIGLDQREIENYFSRIQQGLIKKHFKVWNHLDTPYNNTYFSQENHVTLATINKAKGNETGMVYIVGVDAVFRQKDYIIDRNKLFTAITRSKGWVTISGYEEVGKPCEKELLILKEKKYKLDFIQPSIQETKTILRGMTEAQSLLNQINKQIELFSKNTGLSEEEIRKMINNQPREKK